MTDRKIYDGRPNRDALLARCKRDGVDPHSLVELVVPVRQYAVRLYGHPTTDLVYRHVSPTVVDLIEVPAWFTYETRRDGRVSNAWGHKTRDEDVIEHGPKFA